MKLTPCKHLDYDKERYGWAGVLMSRKMANGDVLRYWCRRDEIVPEGGAKNVQFCRLHGRINSILDCYEPPGPMHCYEAGEGEELTG